MRFMERGGRNRRVADALVFLARPPPSSAGISEHPAYRLSLARLIAIQIRGERVPPGMRNDL